MAMVSTVSTVSMDKLLASRRARLTPGKGFKAKVDGKWPDYAPPCNHFLLEAHAAGCPSMRLNVRGHMYKFDFEKMEQKNLSTMETLEMRAPHDARRPVRSSIFQVDNLKRPFSKGKKSLRDAVWKQRPVFVVRVPAGSAGTTIRVPHPKKLGKAMAVAVPVEADVGQPLFLPMPRTEMKSKAKCAAGGAAVGTVGTAAGVAIGDTIGAVAAGGALASVGGIAALSIGGVVVVGAVVAACAGIHYATRNPVKAVVVGALAIGALSLADHVADVGIVEAAVDVVKGGGDLVEGVGDLVEGVGDFAADAIDAGEDMGEGWEAFLDGADWLKDSAEDGVDIVLDLF